MEERMDFRILNNGSFVPSIGFGTYKTGTSEETEQTVTNALQADTVYLIRQLIMITKKPSARA